MGLRFGKSIRIGKFLRLNISRSGIGGSIGIGGLRIGTGPRGARFSADLPGGLSYVKQFGSGGKRRSSPSRVGATAPQTQARVTTAAAALPAPGFLAPRHEKEFYAGLENYREGRSEEALSHFLAAASEEPGAAILAASILTQRADGMSEPQAIALLESVVQKDEQFPTPLMEKYLAESRLPVSITPQVSADVPVNGLAATLLLVELYQRQGRADEAIGLLEEIEELAGDPVLTLSLCELYADRAVWDGIIERAKHIKAEDDVTLETVIFYGRAMQAKGLHDAAVSVFTEALRRKKNRHPALLREAKYWRAISYQATGKKSLANREFQKLYAEAPDFRDIAQRVIPS
jgi:tetratricopeptide (TPR) repeat protein